MNDDKIYLKAFDIFNKVQIHFEALWDNKVFSVKEKNEVIFNYTCNMFIRCCVYYNDDEIIDIAKSINNFHYLQEFMIDKFKKYISDQVTMKANN